MSLWSHVQNPQPGRCSSCKEVHGLLPFAEVIYVGHNPCNPLPPFLTPQVKRRAVPPACGWGGTPGPFWQGPWCPALSVPCLYRAPWGSGAQQCLSEPVQPLLLGARGSCPPSWTATGPPEAACDGQKTRACGFPYRNHGHLPCEGLPQPE